ncbi:hypothetical protein [Arachnia propionica]|uniref:hypothetical protein n=1 Tax=Arachnia propionica TaxID=1750 RepID=UPI00399D16EC
MFAATSQPVRLEDLVNRLKRYRMIFCTTETASRSRGGEPLMQPAFVGRLLHEAKQLGIHTAIDTSGFLGVNASDALLDDLDLVLLDIKVQNPRGLQESHRTGTSADAGFRTTSVGAWHRGGVDQVRAGSGPHRRRRKCGGGGRDRGADLRRDEGGGAALPPDGSRQVGDPGAALRTGRHLTAVEGTDRAGQEPVPGAGNHHLLTNHNAAAPTMSA